MRVRSAKIGLVFAVAILLIIVIASLFALSYQAIELSRTKSSLTFAQQKLSEVGVVDEQTPQAFAKADATLASSKYSGKIGNLDMTFDYPKQLSQHQTKQGDAVTAVSFGSSQVVADTQRTSAKGDILITVTGAQFSWIGRDITKYADLTPFAVKKQTFAIDNSTLVFETRNKSDNPAKTWIESLVSPQKQVGNYAVITVTPDTAETESMYKLITSSLKIK